MIKSKNICVKIEDYDWIMSNRGKYPVSKLFHEMVEERKKQVSARPVEQQKEIKKIPLEDVFKSKPISEDIKTKRIAELQNKNRNPFEDVELKKLLSS